MTTENTPKQAGQEIHSPQVDSKIYLIPGNTGSLDQPSEAKNTYKVYGKRWVILAFFVAYSCSNSMQWTQYSIIADIVMKYYKVSGNVVSWTSLVYMVTYVPLIFPASYLLDKTTGTDVGQTRKIRRDDLDDYRRDWPEYALHRIKWKEKEDAFAQLWDSIG